MCTYKEVAQQTVPGCVQKHILTKQKALRYQKSSGARLDELKVLRGHEHSLIVLSAAAESRLVAEHSEKSKESEHLQHLHHLMHRMVSSLWISSAQFQQSTAAMDEHTMLIHWFD